MKYHDNDVYLSLTAGYTLISASYTVNSFYVSKGQDPDGHIYNGLKVTCGSDGKLTFKVGQNDTTETATWFNGKVGALQNTFGHTAGKLNFAFLGTLVLTVKGGVLGGGQDTFTFNNVALAQGKDVFSNNWWYGGQQCTYIQNHQVTCKGVNSKGGDITFVFLRGGSGNGVNTVGVTPSTFVDTANWMQRVQDSVALDMIMMPGSHDAGMSELHHCTPPLFGDASTKTQSGSVGQQLMDGSRYFDIRVDYDYSTLVTYHRTNGLGCNGQDLKVVLDQTRAFLKDHPTETAILKFSHIRDYDDHKASDTKAKVNDMLSSYQGIMYVNSNAGTNLAGVTMGSLRGKMLVVCDYDEYINPSTGRFRYKDGGTIQPGANITVYDKYSETSDYEVMKTTQLERWKQYGGLGAGRFFLLSWTLTADATHLSVESMAKKANANLPGVLHDQIITNHATKPNIVYIDFLNNTVAQSIILYNL